MLTALTSYGSISTTRLGAVGGYHKAGAPGLAAAQGALDQAIRSSSLLESATLYG